MARDPLSDADLQTVGRIVRDLWLQQSVPDQDWPTALHQPGVVYVAARGEGRLLAFNWSKANRAGAALVDAVTTVRRNVGDGRIDWLEINLAHSFRHLNDPTMYQRDHFGLRGLEFEYHGQLVWHAPTTMIARNRYLSRSVEVKRQQREHIRIFDADQLLVPLASEQSVVRLFRGNRVVSIEEITRPYVERLARLQTDWLFNHLQPDGRMRYRWQPGSASEGAGNNMIRQWMATVAMGRAALRDQDGERLRYAARNIDFNLSHYYDEEAGLGLIVEDGHVVKLGAVALAALAIHEHPQSTDWAIHEEALQRMMLHLWTPSGRFRTFFRPAELQANENFYPGETLLYWAFRYEKRREEDLLEHFMQTFRFYREWHLENRNPAFIPWHTQAYYLIWTLTRDDELKEFIFLMNDWLLDMQQWDEHKEFPDIMGRFFDPERPFGPPHASSTGVYLEGLIDAWRLAREVGDHVRQERYRQAIIRGLRSVAQLTFQQESDYFYSENRVLAQGGVRTTVYNSEIRVDNVQHNLMAILKILEHMDDVDFRP